MPFKSFAQLYTDCQTFSSDSDTATLAFFKSQLNTAILRAYSVLNAEHFYTETTDDSVDGQQSYPRPYNDAKIVSMYVTVDSTKYPIIEFSGSENDWLALNSTTTHESEMTQYFYPKRDTYELYPIPSVDDNTMTLRVKQMTKELTQADYTTGTVLTLANAGTAVTGTSTVWDATFVGRFFKIDADYHWYLIATRTNDTSIVIAREYGGTAISSGTASYTIGEGSLLPFDYQEIPINYALWQYFKLKKQFDKATVYKADWLENLEDLKSYGSSDTTSGVLGEDIYIKDPNQWPTDLDYSP